MTGDWISKITHSGLKSWIEEVIALVSPDDVRLCDGSEAEYQQLCQQMQDAGVDDPS